MHRSRPGPHPRTLFGVTILLVTALAMPAWAQSSAASRHEVLRRVRADKAAALHAYAPGRLERWLSALENEQTFENLFEVLSPSAGGYYLTLGDITTGAGLTLGTGYNVRSWWGDRMSLAVRAAGSLRRYWKAEVEASFPRLAGGRAFVTSPRWPAGKTSRVSTTSVPVPTRDSTIAPAIPTRMRRSPSLAVRGPLAG